MNCPGVNIQQSQSATSYVIKATNLGTATQATKRLSCNMMAHQPAPQRDTSNSVSMHNDGMLECCPFRRLGEFLVLREGHISADE